VPEQVASIKDTMTGHHYTVQPTGFIYHRQEHPACLVCTLQELHQRPARKGVEDSTVRCRWHARERYNGTQFG
jgi:hypothetical protein